MSKKLGRKKQYPPTIHVVGKSTNLMLGRIANPKYHDHGSPIFTIHIGRILIQNTLVHLVASINIMTKEAMETLKL